MTTVIEIFESPGCQNCVKATDLLKHIIQKYDLENIQWHKVSVLDEIDYAVEMGILATPAIVINGQLVFTSLPCEERFYQEITKRV
jgi:glutaredoxin